MVLGSSKDIFIGACLCVMLGIWAQVAVAVAVDSPSVVPQHSQTVSQGPSEQPYCGLYSLYAAALHEGVRFPFQDLLKTEYLHCSKGSSLADLERAAHDKGLHAYAMGGMGLDFLGSRGHPVILHVRSSLASHNFNHYVLSLGRRDGGFAVLDPGSPTRVVSSGELLSIWDGTGLVVSATLAGEDRMDAERLRGPLGWGAGIALLAVAGSLVRRYDVAWLGSRPRWGGWRRATLQLSCIAALAAVAALVINTRCEGGLLRTDAYVDNLKDAYLANFVPRLSVSEAGRLQASGGAVFVDARHAIDHKEGHIDGALSVPVSFASEQRRAAMSGVPLSATVVVYCQSRNCPYAQWLSRDLAKDGYTAVKILRGGWDEWDRARMPSKGGETQ